MDLKSLPFVKVNVNDIVTDFWNVEPTHDYQADCATGRSYFVQLYRAMQSNPTLYNSVVQAIVLRAQWTGVEIGFFQAASNELTA